MCVICEKFQANAKLIIDEKELPCCMACGVEAIKMKVNL